MLQGGCYCGQVRYEVDATPFHETTCHCSSCRRVIGAPMVTWFSAPRTALRFTKAAPTQFRSSPTVIRQFCGTCGTALTFEDEAHPDEVDITTASLDDPAAVPPKDHTRVSEKLPWIILCDDLPAYPDRRPPPKPS